MNTIQKFISANLDAVFTQVSETENCYLIQFMGYSNNFLTMGIVEKTNPNVVVMENSKRMWNTFEINCGAALERAGFVVKHDTETFNELFPSYTEPATIIAGGKYEEEEVD